LVISDLLLNESKIKELAVLSNFVITKERHFADRSSKNELIIQIQILKFQDYRFALMMKD
jgi:hypothetical protein